MRGFSPRNLKYMRALEEARPTIGLLLWKDKNRLVQCMRCAA